MASQHHSVLVVDDEQDLRALLEQTLAASGYDVTLANDGRAGIKAFFELRPDLVILDVAMPEMDGWTALARIREIADTPVIMLTAMGEVRDRVAGLKQGADDYVVKPFSPAELVARCDAVLRRGRRPEPEIASYRDSAISVDFDRREAYAGGEKITLSPLEYRLLVALVQNAGRVLDPEFLMDSAWGSGYGSRESLRVYIGALRRKLPTSTEGDGLIETVRGFGYRYTPPDG